MRKIVKHGLHQIVLVLLLASLLVACQPQDTTPSQYQAGSPEPAQEILPAETPQPTVAPTQSPEEQRAAIVNALLALSTRPNRMDSTTVLSDGQPRRNVIEFAPPDRKRISTPDQGVEYVVVDGKVYAKTGAEAQWAMTEIPAATFLGEGAVTSETISAQITTILSIREEPWEGQAVLVYTYEGTTQASGLELHSRTELWVGVEDGLPVKMVVDGEIISTSFNPDTGESSVQAVQAVTTTIITFDEGIVIEAPLID